MSEIMIFKEKHSDSYYVVETPADRAKVALKVLRERNAETYWYPNEEDVNEDRDLAISRVNNKYDQSLIELTEDEVEALPDSLKIMTEQTRRDYAASMANVERIYESDIRWVNDLNLLLTADPDEAIKMTYTTPRGRNINLATRILDSRVDHEYEGYVIEHSESY